MPSTTNLPLRDAAKRTNVPFSKLLKWCEDGRVPSHENLEGTHRFVSVSVLPLIEALRDGREPCLLCRNTGRAIIAGIAQDCPRCGESREGEPSARLPGSPLNGYVPVSKVEGTDVTTCNCDWGSPQWHHHAVTCPLGDPA